MIYRTVGSSGSFGASRLEQHIGLAKAAKIKVVEISWPTSKTRQEFTNAEKNEFVQVREFEKTLPSWSDTLFASGERSAGQVSVRICR